MKKCTALFVPSKLLVAFILYSIALLLVWQVFDLSPYLLVLLNTELPSWFVAVFTLAYIVRGFFYIPSLYFIVAASLLFTFPFSAGVYLIGVLLSASLSYTIGRLIRDNNYFPRLRTFVEQKDIKQQIERRGLYGVFGLHLIGFLDIPNYSSGYLRLPFVKFLATVMLANFITTTAYFLLYEMGAITLTQLLG